MCILQQIVKYFHPIYMQDPLFGTIRFSKVGLWVGKVFLAPIGAEAEATVSADRTGPTETQRAIFRTIGERYGKVLETALDRLSQEAVIIDAHLARENLRDDMRFDGIYISGEDLQQAEFAITFYVRSIGQMATFSFKEWRIEAVIIEC